MLRFVHLGTFFIDYPIHGDYANDIIYENVILNIGKNKQIARYFFNFRVLLSRCGLHATEDPNRDKPVCLKTASFMVTA